MNKINNKINIKNIDENSNENNNQELKLKDVIKKLEWVGEIFIHKYDVTGTQKYQIDELTDKQLNSKVISVNQHYGGMEYKYNAHMVVIK